jgi:hypothetical protein
MKQELEDEARRIMSEADSLINLSQPRLTKEEVVLCTEQITKRIQELLLAAQAGRHSRYVGISGRRGVGPERNGSNPGLVSRENEVGRIKFVFCSL